MLFTSILEPVKRFLPVIILALCALLLYTAVARDSTLSQTAQTVWDNLSYPFRLAYLSTQPADQSLLMPVEGVRVRDVADTWGAPRSSGRRHEGQDIFAPRNTAIRSATDGFVTRISDTTLGGNSVFVTGTGGVRYYYTHLEGFASNLRTGLRVTPDTVLGYVGNSGNAATTPTHLHFGVYTPTGAVNPLPLLKDR